jgi:dTDP-4-amino-4,6-dideoxygalactose transaminase
LHQSIYYQSQHTGKALIYADAYTDHLLRLPFYYELEINQIEKICDLIIKNYE